MSILAKNFHLINIPPLVGITFFFGIGIACHAWLSLFAIIYMALICSAVFCYVQKFSVPKQMLLWSFFALAGAWLHHKELQDYRDFYALIENKKFSVTGIVTDMSHATVNHHKTNVFTLKIETIATDCNAKKSNKLLIFYSNCNKNIAVGDTVTIPDIRCKMPSDENFQRYQIKEQIVATIFNDTLTYQIDYRPTWSLRRFVWQQKTRLLCTLKNKLSFNGFNFFSSLFLGNRVCIKAELQETNDLFKTWGISHFLARSGLHLVLFILIWQAFFCLIPLPLVLKQIIISILSLVYFVLTWTSAPFTRSFALFMLNKFCLFTKTSFHLVHYLTLVCFGFLLYCPLYLFFLDFQLSFALTCALAWFNQVAIEHKSE